MSNYPDDIRNYDNDPRSPFFREPECSRCGEVLEGSSVEDCECTNTGCPECPDYEED